MKAETGKFKSQLQQDQGPAMVQEISGSAVVVGVVQMHNTLVEMARALRSSNELLEQLLIIVDEPTGYIETSVNVQELQKIIGTNIAILGGINLDRP